MAITTALRKIEKTLYESTFYKVIQGGACFPAGTEVLLSDGSYCPIEKLKKGQMLFSREGSCGIIKTEVGNVWYAGSSKPMITIKVGGEKVKATYDHKFYSAGEYKELYKIAWGKMEESQRVQLKLLCKQYGTYIDDVSTWQEKQPYDNETVTRLRLPNKPDGIFEDGNGQTQHKGASCCCNDLGSEPTRKAIRKSQEWGQDRQQSRESGVGDKLGEPTSRLQNRATQTTERRRKPQIKTDGQRSDADSQRVGRGQEQIISQGVCQEVQCERIDYQGRSGESQLEVVAIDKVWVSEPEKVYSLEVNHPSHNYFVSRENLNVSNSAGKTFAILTLLVGYCQSYADSLVTVVGLSYPHLEAGSIRDFVKIMKEVNIWEEDRWNKTAKIYEFANGSILEFKSIDRMSARGPRRDVLFVNEANGITFEIFQELATRTKDFCIVDYNPSSKFWAHEELVEGLPSDTTYIILTYKDNEALSAREVANIESHKPKPGEEPSNYWIVYGLGQIGSLEGNVFEGWEETSADEIARNGKLVRYGLDFGFSNDETALVAAYEMPDGSLGLVEKLYKKGMLGSEYPAELNAVGVDPNVLIVADSARPEIIAEIKRAGFRIIGADKAPGSVLKSIDYLKQYQVLYNGSNLKKEYLAYAWRKKRTGEVLDEPQDGFDHLIDACRYIALDLKKKRIEF